MYPEPSTKSILFVHDDDASLTRIQEFLSKRNLTVHHIKCDQINRFSQFKQSFTFVVLGVFSSTLERAKEQLDTLTELTEAPIYVYGKAVSTLLNHRSTQVKQIELGLQGLSLIEAFITLSERPESAQPRQIRLGIVGESTAIERVKFLVSRFAQGETTVLITGPNGSGKELVARGIHKCSRRSNKKLLTVNCAAISDTLIESELFGYVGGSFSGANTKGKKGLFAAAHEGTLFLDEVAELPISVQAKLLRVLQEGTFLPVGAEKEVKVDVRIIAATNVDLEQAVAQNRFRADLFHRLNCMRIENPSLADRKSDVPVLIDYFLRTEAKRNGCARLKIKATVKKVLIEHNWTGNIRELKAFIQRAYVLCESEIHPDELPFLLTQRVECFPNMWYARTGN